MNKLSRFFALLLFLAVAAPAFAQGSIPGVETFIGASYLPADGQDFPRKTSFGLQTSIAINLNRWFAVAGDFGAQFGKSDNRPGFIDDPGHVSMYEYLAGPRFSVRREKHNIFFHALFGGASGRTKLRDFSDAEIAFGGGGGVDIDLNDRISIRVVQLDYLGSFADMLENNYRVGTGIVFRFGAAQ
jgi:hypothetical protein